MQRAGHANPLPIGAVLLAAIAGITFLNALNISANLAQTSDSAQGFVVGNTIATGNPLLSGWHFPIDNFYFTDSLPYAAAEWIAGSRVYLLAVVPAIVYAFFVLLVLIVCFRPELPPKKYLESVSAIALLLAAPVWIGAWNPILMSDMHTATALAAFAALVLCARFAEAEFRNAFSRTWFAVCLVSLVVFTVASDPFSLVFAFGPAGAVLVGGSVRSTERRCALALLAVAIAAGLLLPLALAALGGFTTENDVSFQFARAAQWWTNLLDVLFGGITLWGANPLDVQDLPGAVIFGMRVVGSVLVVSVVVCVVRDLVRHKEVLLLDRFLLAGAVVSIGICVPSAQFAKGVKSETLWHGGPPTRFLVPAVFFAAILSGRQITSVFDAVRNPKWRHASRRALAPIAGLAVLAGAYQSFEQAAQVPWIRSNPALTVVRWLRGHELSQGVGEYWSANLLTAISGNAVVVRSVVPKGGRLAPYIWVEDWRFYARWPEFVVWQEPNQTRITEKLVRASYPVCGIKRVSGYEIALLNAPGNVAHCS